MIPCGLDLCCMPVRVMCFVKRVLVCPFTCGSMCLCACALVCKHINWAPFSVFLPHIAAGAWELWWHDRSAHSVVLYLWVCKRKASNRIGSWLSEVNSEFSLTKLNSRSMYIKTSENSISLPLQNYARWWRHLVFEWAGLKICFHALAGRKDKNWIIWGGGEGMKRMSKWWK